MSITNGWQPSDPEVARLRDRMLAADAALAARIEGVERTVGGWAEREKEARATHRTRFWQVVVGLTTAIVAPLVVTGVIALLHLRS